MRFRFSKRLLMVAAMIFSALGCDLPRDQRGTLERIESERRVRVGLIENEPWVGRGANGEPSGVEIELTKKFAAELGATPEWFWTNEPDAMDALKNTELDLVVGGLTEKTLWASEVGLTASYYTDRLVVGVPASAAPVQEIEGKRISVEQNDLPAAALVAAENATPVRVENLAQTTDAAAARDWRLEQTGFNLTDIELREDKHVVAVAPGENNFLVRLEKFLNRQRAAIKNMLQQEASREKQREKQ